MAIPNEDEAWIIPLHGAIVPVPPAKERTGNDSSKTQPPQNASTESPPDEMSLLADPDELPTDLGFHPRLRRSA